MPTWQSPVPKASSPSLRSLNRLRHGACCVILGHARVHLGIAILGIPVQPSTTSETAVTDDGTVSAKYSTRKQARQRASASSTARLVAESAVPGPPWAETSSCWRDNGASLIRVSNAPRTSPARLGISLDCRNSRICYRCRNTDSQWFFIWSRRRRKEAVAERPYKTSLRKNGLIPALIDGNVVGGRPIFCIPLRAIAAARLT